MSERSFDAQIKKDGAFMTVKELADRLELTALHLADPEREVAGGYCGDLLSWVMGNAGAGCAWLTIMSNANVAAVAALTDAACVILTEDVAPDAALAQRCAQQGINLLGTKRPTFACAAAVAGCLRP